MFHSHSGLLTIKLISNDTVGRWTVSGEQEPVLGSWMPKDGNLEINSSLQKGLYHFEITIATIDNDKNIFLSQDAPKFDSWWTVDDNGNIFRNYSLTQTDSPLQKISEISFPHRGDFSPLKQFKSGIPTNNVECNDLKLIIKKSDGNPACVKPQTVQKLVARGWGTLISPVTHQTSDTSSVLRLDLSVNSDMIKSRQAIGIDISLRDTLSKPITIPVANDWPINGLSVSECSDYYPLGIAILEGYYTEQNVTAATPLSLYLNSGCSIGPIIKSYTFQPTSSKTIPECDSVSSCPELVFTKSQLSYSGYDDYPIIHPFNVGNYTVVGGDEWGHIAIQYFTVVNSK